MQLHERFRTLRADTGFRLKDLALQCDLSVPYLSDLERGRTQPSLQTLEALARAYNLTVQQLLSGVDGYGAATTTDSLPSGLAALVADPVLGAGLTPEWIQTLSRIELRGKRPRDKEAWYEIWRHLRRVMV